MSAVFAITVFVVFAVLWCVGWYGVHRFVSSLLETLSATAKAFEEMDRRVSELESAVREKQENQS